MITACNAAWTASFAYETARLLDDLKKIDPELAENLRNQSAECFTPNPNPVFIGSPEYFKRILNSVF